MQKKKTFHQIICNTSIPVTVLYSLVQLHTTLLNNHTPPIYYLHMNRREKFIRRERIQREREMWEAVLLTLAATAGNIIGKVLQKKGTLILPPLSFKLKVFTLI